MNVTDPSGLRGGLGPARLLGCIDTGPSSTNPACQNYWATMQTYSCSDLAVCADPFYALYLAEKQTISDLFNPCVGVGQVGIDELHVIAGNAAIAGLVLGGVNVIDSLSGSGAAAAGAASTASSADLLQELADAGGPTTRVVTNLTQAPAVGRALSVAAGDNADALAAAARSAGSVYSADIPTALLNELEFRGLARVSITNMGGVTGTEIHFLPAASKYIVPFFGGS